MSLLSVADAVHQNNRSRAAEDLLTQAGVTGAEIGLVTAALANPAVKLDDFAALLDGPLAVTKLKSFAGMQLKGQAQPLQQVLPPDAESLTPVAGAGGHLQ